MKYALLSTSVLRGTLLALTKLGIYAEQCAAIRHELLVRRWAEAVEAALSNHACVWTTRGGLS